MLHVKLATFTYWCWVFLYTILLSSKSKKCLLFNIWCWMSYTLLTLHFVHKLMCKKDETFHRLSMAKWNIYNCTLPSVCLFRVLQARVFHEAVSNFKAMCTYVTEVYASMIRPVSQVIYILEHYLFFHINIINLWNNFHRNCKFCTHISTWYKCTH